MGNKLGYAVDNLAATATDFTQGDWGENTPFGWINKGLRGLKDLAPKDMSDRRLGDTDLLRGDEAVPFKYRTEQSITQIIPGYLSRIHQELAIIRTGDASIERLDFDQTDGSFSNLSDVTKSLAGQLFDVKGRLEPAHAETNKLVDRVEKETGGAIPEHLKKAMFDRFLNEAGSVTGAFNVSKLGNASTWGDDLSDDDRAQLASIFNDSIGEDKQYKYSKKLLGIRDYIGDPTEAIKAMVASGNLEHMRSLGYITGTGADREVSRDQIANTIRRGTLDDVNKGPFDTRVSGPNFGPGVHGGGGGAPPIPTNGSGGRNDSLLPPPVNTSELDRVIEGLQEGNDRLLQAFIEANNSNPQREQQLQSLLSIYELLASGSLVSQSIVIPKDAIEATYAALKARVKGLPGSIKGQFTKLRSKLPSFKPVKDLFKNGLRGVAAGLHSRIKNTAFGRLLSRGAGRFKDLKELYVNGELMPKLTQAKLDAKEYYDSITGNLITKWEDIKGPIKNGAGEWIVTAEDWAKGLVDNKGRPYFDKVKGKILDKYNALKSGLNRPFRIGKIAVRKSYRAIRDFINKPRDIYIPGQKLPILLASVMQAGGYFNADGSPIRTWKDIKGTVYDIEKNVVVSLETLRQGLVDAYGNKMQSLKDSVISKVKTVGSFVNKTVNRVWGDTKKVIGKGMKFLKGGFKGIAGRLTGGSSEMMETIGEYQILLLEEIRDAVRSLKPKKVKGDSDGDGDRDGSWSDITANRKKRREELAAGRGKKKGLLGKVKQKGKDLFGLLASGFSMLKGIPSALMSIASVISIKKGLGAVGDLLGGGLGKAGRGIGKVARGAMSLGRGAMIAGRVGLGLASMAGSGLMAAGSAILATVGAPVLLGVAAAVAVGAGAWWLWKKYKKANLSPLMRLRMAQYGFDPSVDDHVNKMLAFEDLLKPGVTIQGGKATVDLKKVDRVKLLELFELKDTDPDAIESWSAWFDARFKPVYVTHYALADQYAGGDLSDVDGALKEEDRLKYLKAARLEDDSIYDKLTSPWKDVELTQGADEVNAIFDELSEKFKEKASEQSVKEGVAVAGAGAAGTIAAKSGFGSKIADMAKRAFKYTPMGLLVTAATTSFGLLSKAYNWVKDKFFGQDFKVPSILHNEIDPLTSIRYRLYGLSAMDYVRAAPISRLEEAVIKDITYTGKKVAEWDGDIEDLYKEVGGAFVTDADNEDTTKRWTKWFSDRFLPVFINYLTSIRGFLSSGNPFEAYDSLRPPQALEVARFMNRATPPDEDSDTVWSIATSPFDDYPMNTDPNSIQPFILAIENDAKLTALREKIQADVVAKATGGSPKPPSQPSMLLQNNRSGSGQSPLLSAMYSSTPTAGGSRGYTGGGMSVLGMTGVGGAIGDLVNPTGPDGQYETYKDLLQQVAKMAGVDPGLLAVMAGVESGFRAKVKASESSATGLFQFIGTTWTEMLQKYGAKYGLDATAKREDPRANALMGAEFIKENMSSLRSSLGREPTDIDTYLAHFLGAGGAKQFLKADPNGNAAAAMPTAASSNKSIFFEDGRPRTFAQVYAEVDKRMNVWRGTAGSQARSLAGLAGIQKNATVSPIIPGITPMSPTQQATSTTSAPTTTTSGTVGVTPISNSTTSSSDASVMGYSASGLPAPAIVTDRASSAPVGTATLRREKSTDAGTYGIFTTPDGSSFQSLELPWRNNETGKSCIPPGTYRCETRESSKFGRVYEVKGVPGRSAILIHAGNYAGNSDKGQKSDVQGCILLGLKRGQINGQPVVQESKAAIEAFKQKLNGGSFMLTVSNDASDSQTVDPVSTTGAEPAAYVPSPIAKAMGIDPANKPLPLQTPISSSFQPTNSTQAPTGSTGMAPSEVALIQKQRLEREAASIQEQGQERSRVEGANLGGVEGVLVKQLEIQQSMDTTLKSIDAGIKTLGGQSGATNTPPNTPSAIRGNRGASVESTKPPISMRR